MRTRQSESESKLDVIDQDYHMPGDNQTLEVEQFALQRRSHEEQPLR